jgi:hypothetical protein
MSLYVVPENQELLWNVINKNVFVQQYFSKFPPEKQHQWFQSVIRVFYEKYKGSTISVNDLHTINRDTMSYMIENIRQLSTQSAPVNTVQTPPHIPENKQDAYQNEFQHRQQEYKQMVEKKTPDGIDFLEKTSDTAISNMDELVKQHTQQREAELNQYSPPPPVQVQSEQVIANPTVPTPNMIDLMEQMHKQLTIITDDIQSQKQLLTHLNETVRSLQDHVAELYDAKHRPQMISDTAETI